MMRWLVLLLGFLWAVPASAQFTAVSGTVTDPNGLPYSNGTISPAFVASTGAPTLNGLPYSPPQTAGLDKSGSFTFNLADNNVLLPAGSQWKFTVCGVAIPPPLGFGGAPCFTSAAITITGASQSITTQLSSAALAQSRVTSGGAVGSVLTTGDISISAAWGTTATKAVVGTPRDFINIWLLTANGTGIAPSPTLTLTFHDGPYTNTPVCTANWTGGTGSIADWTVSSRNGSAYTFIFNTTPVAGSTYEVTVECGNQGFAPGGGSPGGGASELQYRATATTFGAVTGSSVSGANVTLGGKITAGTSSTASARFVPVSTLPATCTISDLVQFTLPNVAFAKLMQCRNTNTWVDVGEPGQGSPAVIYVERMAGSDMGAQIAACDAIISGGFGAGVCDARGMAGSQTMASAMTTHTGTTVLLGGVTLTEATGAIWTCNEGCRIIGIGTASGASGTTITQANSANNAELINAITVGDFWHYGRIQDLRIDGNKANNTTGIGILITDIGENALVKNVFIKNCPQDGIKTTSSASPSGATGAAFEDISLFQNGGYGINLNQAGQVWHLVNISADDNTLGLIRYNGTGTLYVEGLKSESPVSLDNPIIDIAPVAATTPAVILDNASIQGFAGLDIFKVESGGGNAYISMRGSYANGSPNSCVNDLINGLTFPISECFNVPIFAYTTDVSANAVFTHNITVGSVLGGGRIQNFYWLAGAAITANQLLKISPTVTQRVLPMATTDTSGFVGVANETAASGAQLHVATYGLVSVILDSGSCVRGSFVFPGTVTPGRALCAPNDGLGRIGIALSVQAVAGSFFTMWIAPGSGAPTTSLATVHSTANTAAISTATLCAATVGACNQTGQYRIHWDFWGSGTACSNVTAGSVTFLLTWTDANAVTHSAVALQMMGQTGAATTAIGGTFPFQTALANEGASGDFNVSTNGSIVQYATGYTACTTGTGTYNLDIAVTRLQ